MKIPYTLYAIRNTSLHRILFYLLVILLPSQLGLHFWPVWSQVLGRRVDYLSPTLYVTDILILLTLSTWAYTFIAEKLNHELGILSTLLRAGMNYGKKNSTSIHASVFILLCVLLNIVFSLSPAESVYHWVKVLEFGLLGLYIVKTKPPLYMIQVSLLISIFYSSLIAIVQFLLQHSIGGPLFLLGERTFSTLTGGIAQFSWCFYPITSGCSLILRAYGTFPHPNVLGGFLALCIPFMLIRTKHPEQSQKNIFTFMRVLAIALGVIALILTFSRSAIFVGIVGFLYVFITSRVNEYRISTRYWIPLIGILSILCIYPLSLILDKTHESVAVRILLNQSAIEIWRTSPWFGVGLGNFIVALPSFLPTTLIYFLQPVHNIYLLLLSEVGIVGVLLVLCIVYRVLSLKKYALHNTVYGIPIISLLILGFVDHYPLTLQQGQLLLTLFIGLCLI